MSTVELCIECGAELGYYEDDEPYREVSLPVEACARCMTVGLMVGGEENPE